MTRDWRFQRMHFSDPIFAERSVRRHLPQPASLSTSTGLWGPYWMDDSAIAGAHPPIQPQTLKNSVALHDLIRPLFTLDLKDGTYLGTGRFYWSLFRSLNLVKGRPRYGPPKQGGGVDCKKQILTIQHTPLDVLNFIPINMYFTPDTWQASHYSPNNPTFKTIQLFENQCSYLCVDRIII